MSKKNTPVVAVILTVVTFLSFNLNSVAEEKKPLSSQSVRIVVQEPKDDPDKPELWQPEITVGTVISADELQRVKGHSFEKKKEREAAAFRRKQAATGELYQSCRRKEFDALQILKTKDPQAAIYWMEQQIFLTLLYNSKPVPPDEPTSEAYKAFRAAIQEVEKQQNAGMVIVEESYERAHKRANELYEAEVERAELFFDKGH